ncbi:unnamed protein product [Rhizoctonia solani]|uniref:Uncharacterized protein n=1 Tax=Rhizoctonia solani TaxID=456999 RepID=A0A8H2WAS9_9AGAM|nr:unnamed protein product [Rhizoctonia solani]
MSCCLARGYSKHDISNTCGISIIQASAIRVGDVYDPTSMRFWVYLRKVFKLFQDLEELYIIRTPRILSSYQALHLLPPAQCTLLKHQSDCTHSPKIHYSSSILIDMDSAQSAKEAEYLAERAATRARSHNRSQETPDAYCPLRPSRHMRASGLNTPFSTSSDMFSPPIPTTPLPQYSYLPQYSPPRRSREVPRELSPEPQRRTSTRSASREMSPPPKYHKEDVAYCDAIYYGGKARSTGRILPRSKPIKTFDVDSIYSLAASHVVDMTPPKPGRLALAASRESRSSKKEFESHKRHAHNYAPLTEELGISHEVDDIATNILEDIAAIGGSGRQTARAAFHHAFSKS